MKAMVIQDFGGPEVFTAAEVGQPQIHADEVLVKVHATSVNPVDYKLRRHGAPAGITPPAILGYDVSGVVEAVGAAVYTVTVGEEVYYSPEILGKRSGSYAEYHAARAAIVAPKPVNLSHEQAASLPLAGMTAWDALIEKARLKVGESVLIHGAGGVGTLALQIAKAAGAYVIVTCSAYMIDAAMKLGADHAIDYKVENFVDVVKAKTDGFDVDVVLDTVGGDTLTRSIPVTKPFGRLVGIVSTDTGFQDAFNKNLDVYPTYMHRARYKLEALRVLLERGALKPVIDSVVPLAKVAQAHRRLEQGGVKGKIVLRVVERGE
jgi:NADPH:quinone reductase